MRQQKVEGMSLLKSEMKRGMKREIKRDTRGRIRKGAVLAVFFMVAAAQIESFYGAL